MIEQLLQALIDPKVIWNYRLLTSILAPPSTEKMFSQNNGNYFDILFSQFKQFCKDNTKQCLRGQNKLHFAISHNHIGKTINTSQAFGNDR